MGGYGSGRWGTHTKNYIAEECLMLNVDKLVRDRLLRPGFHAFGSFVWSVKSTGREISRCAYEFDMLRPADAWLRLTYTTSNIKEQVSYRVNYDNHKASFDGGLSVRYQSRVISVSNVWAGCIFTWQTPVSAQASTKASKRRR